jgi:hypothetical protein
MISNKQGPISYNRSSRSYNDDTPISQRNRANQSFEDYQLNTTFAESNSKCFLKSSPFIRSTDKSIPSNLVDTETALKGINRIGAKYGLVINNEPDCKDCENCGKPSECSCLHCHITKQQANLVECEDTGLTAISTKNNTNYTRADINNLERYDFIYENLNDSTKIQSNNIIGINSRLALKDSKRTY